MSKYDALGSYLSKQFGSRIPMTFAEIEGVVGAKLPPKAQHHRAWWSNNPSNNVMTKVWLAAGFQTEQVDMAARKLVFVRKNGRDVSPPIPSSVPVEGMAEAKREFVPAHVARHPALGSMKGTFTIEPGYDLAQSPFSPEELAEMDANLDRTADMIEAGMRRKT